MASTDRTADADEQIGLLDKERIIAPPGYNRWLVPPAALAIHLCIGMAYGFSVFWLPLGRALGVADGTGKPIVCPADATTFGGKLVMHAARRCSPRVATGPSSTSAGCTRCSSCCSAPLPPSGAAGSSASARAEPASSPRFCWCGGLMISALGVYMHQLWLMWLGSGIIGGCGLGLGYISPVSTLIKWFPDRRGMATGMAIMGFGGGAMIGSPLATMLMNHYATPTSRRRVGDLRHHGHHLFRVHDGRRLRLSVAAGGLEAGRLDAAGQLQRHDHHRQRASQGRAQDAAILADLGGALPQRLGRHRHYRRRLAHAAGDLRRQAVRRSFRRLRAVQRRAEGTMLRSSARRFVGLFSLFNIAGRFFWASLSDKLGRKLTYFTFFTLGFLCYAAAPTLATLGMLGAIRGRLLPHRLDVWRRLRHHPCLSRRYFRHAVRRRHSRAPAHRLVDGGHRRAGDRQLHARHPQSRRRPPRPDLSPDLLCSGRAAGRRLHRQSADQAVGQEVVHERGGGGGAAGQAEEQGRGRDVHPRQRLASTSGPCSPGPRSAFRSPGASGSRSRRRSCCSISRAPALRGEGSSHELAPNRAARRSPQSRIFRRGVRRRHRPSARCRCSPTASISSRTPRSIS